MGRKKPAAQSNAETEARPLVRTPRVRTLLTARLQRADGWSTTIRVRDLSETGLGAVRGNFVDLVVGENVQIGFLNVEPVAAEVISLSDTLIGFRFRNRVDLERLAKARLAAIAPNLLK
ncbi:MAG: hypothetical protein NVS3B5_09850 [Sphingomicrobium sp.]